jgi:secreted PhoX family phosphatase
MDRRRVLLSGLFFGGGALLSHGRGWAFAAEPYGPLAPVADDETGLPLLRLPKGFRYRSFGWTGDAMAGGAPTPSLHDGMAPVRQLDEAGDAFVLMRNHERLFAPPFGGTAPVYDTCAAPNVAGCGGGTTALVFEDGGFSATIPTLAGTLSNCAGGATPWGSWLSCEELIVDAREGLKAHGYVFEVPSPDLGSASARPIVGMGRMKHEAVAVDPSTGDVYLTEDNGPMGPSGLYRFRPRDRSSRVGALEQGGTLEMLAVRDRPNADLGSAEQGDTHAVRWVAIDEPDAGAERNGVTDGFPVEVGLGRSGPFMQGEARGGAAFRRLEGCFAHGGRIYFTDTIGGAAAAGTLWALTLAASDAGVECVYASPGEREADNIDNVCVSPRGGLAVCEDGGGVVDGTALLRGNRLLGLAPSGPPFPFVENNMLLERNVPERPWIEPADYRSMEFAGVCYSPRGDRLFVNIQTPGVTFEIRGPWGHGPL